MNHSGPEERGGESKGRDESKSFQTLSGIPLKELYTPADIPGFDCARKLGLPGEMPFTRGVYPTMYRGRPWTQRMFSGFGSAQDTNERFRFLLEQGQSGLSVAFDFPTLYGRDSDDPIALGEVGVCGVAIDTLSDFEALFNQIPLGKVSTSMTINPPAGTMIAMYLAVAEKQGVPPEKLRGTTQNDMLKEFHAQNTWIYPPKHHMRLVGDIVEFCTERVPKWNTISVSGYHIREAGSTAAQELAFTLADGLAYAELGVRRGLDIDAFAPRLSFFFNAHLDFFEEIAKYRAARRIWARYMTERFRAKTVESHRCRFHVQTAGCSLTTQQPLNNIVRTAFQALGAVLGGAQSLHTNSYDEAHQLPSEEAVLVALRTQQVILEETGVAGVTDPLGGGYYVEWLTDRLEQETEAYFEKVLDMGSGSFLDGVLEGIERGYFRREIQQAAYEHQRRVERGEFKVVGVNDYITDEPDRVPDFVIGPQTEEEQTASLKRIRSERDGAAASRALNALSVGAKGDANLMPLILDAVKAYCSIGEIHGTLKEVWGQYSEPQTV